MHIDNVTPGVMHGWL